MSRILRQDCGTDGRRLGFVLVLFRGQIWKYQILEPILQRCNFFLSIKNSINYFLCSFGINFLDNDYIKF